MAKKTKAGRIAGEHVLLPVGVIRGNPRNYNTCSKFIFAKLVESIAEFGFTDPVIVREVDGGYEMIGGHHRLKAAEQLGMEEVPAINLGAVSDSVANRMLVVLNETKGSPDQDALASLVQHIKEVGGEDDLQVLPFNDAQLSDLLDDLGEDHVFDEGDDVTEADVKPAKIKPSDVAGCFELNGVSQAELLKIITALREWRTDKDPKVPAWKHLLAAIKRDLDA